MQRKLQDHGEKMEIDTFGQRLRRMRLSKNLSQKDLAELVGGKNSSISNYEKDVYMPRMDMVRRLASALGTTPDYLMGERGSDFIDISRLTEHEKTIIRGLMEILMRK